MIDFFLLILVKAKPKQLLRDILDFNAFNNALRNSIQLEGPRILPPPPAPVPVPVPAPAPIAAPAWGGFGGYGAPWGGCGGAWGGYGWGY